MKSKKMISGFASPGWISDCKKVVAAFLFILCLFAFSGCMVDQHPENDAEAVEENVQTMLEITDPVEKEALVKEFEDFYEEYKKKNEGKDKPKVLVLMGLPGSYIIATENSYVGSLVELAGGENVYAGTDQEFLTVNTEDMETKKPDVILRAAHALPDQVMEMFKEDFETNDIWKHFDAVQNGRVYDLTYEYFGMSANFSYPEALEELQPMLYPEKGETS